MGKRDSKNLEIGFQDTKLSLLFFPNSLAASFWFPLLVPPHLPNLLINGVTQSCIWMFFSMTYNHSLDFIPSYIFMYLRWFALKCVTPVSTFPLNSGLICSIAYSLFPTWLFKGHLIITSQHQKQNKTKNSLFSFSLPSPLLPHQNFSAVFPILINYNSILPMQTKIS